MLVDIRNVENDKIVVNLDLVPVAREFISLCETDEKLDYKVVIGAIFQVLYTNRNIPVDEDAIEMILDAIAAYSGIEIYTDEHDEFVKVVKKAWQPIRSIEIRYDSLVWSLDYIDTNKGKLYMKR